MLAEAVWHCDCGAAVVSWCAEAEVDLSSAVLGAAYDVG